MPTLARVPALVLHHRDALYDVVLLAHVLAALVSLVAVVVAGSAAVALARAPEGSPASRRYYDGRTNWPGRALVAVPVLGAVLIALSGGDWTWGTSWVVVGLGLWVVAATVAEFGLWPTERRIADQLATTGPPPELARAGRRAAVLAGVVAAAVVVATVVMVAKP
jgi:hypothetical protein